MKISIFSENRADLGGLEPVAREAKVRHHDVCVINSLVDFQGADWFVVLGDRVNVLRAVIDVAERHRQTGIAHLSGGDRQSGALIDEPCRHSISKFAHVHFPCTVRSANRLLRQSEDENRIYTVGSTMVDDLVSFRPVDQNRNLYFLVAMHPGPGWVEDLNWIASQPYRFEFVRPNGDFGFGTAPTLPYTSNLARADFLQLLWNAKTFIGNSSALYLEAQYLGVPCAQIGPRNSDREEAFPGHVVRHGAGQEFDDWIGFAQYRDKRENSGLRANWREGAHGSGGSAKKIMDVLEGIGIPSPEFLKKDWR